MKDPVFVAFLFSSGRNCATFGFGGSECNAMYSPQIEIRTPSLMPWSGLNHMLYEFDREAIEVNSWQKLYQWLGHQLPGQGWACFTEASAAELVSHWFSESTEYRCRLIGSDGPYFDIDLSGNEVLGLDSASEMLGATPDDTKAQRIFAQLGTNFVVTRRPIFLTV